MAGHPHIVVTGLMGVGKTTTATALATRLGWPLRDSDSDIESVYGRKGSDLVNEIGLDELHRLEASMLLGALANADPTVIAAAGWVVEDPLSRTAMRRRARVAVLKIDLDQLVARIASGDHRRSMSRSALVVAERTRAPLFASLASWTLDARLPTDHLVDAITQ